MTAPALELDRFQRWMQAVITHPGGAAAGADGADARALLDVGAAAIEAVCEPSAELTGLRRIGIYAGMYFSRLVEVLADDFPAVQYALGDEPFARIARAYVQAHPSQHFSLNVLGRRFAEFLRHEADDVPHRAFVADLARLQWAMQEVFDAPRATPVTVDALLGVPPDAWDRTALRLVPAHRLLTFDYAVNAFLQAYRDGEKPEVPGERNRTWLLLYRKHFRVWREDLDAAQYALLAGLADGAPLGDALAAAVDVPGADAEAVGARVGGWFRTWAAHGLFAAVEPS